MWTPPGSRARRRARRLVGSNVIRMLSRFPFANAPVVPKCDAHRSSIDVGRRVDVHAGQDYHVPVLASDPRPVLWGQRGAPRPYLNGATVGFTPDERSGVPQKRGHLGAQFRPGIERVQLAHAYNIVPACGHVSLPNSAPTAQA